MSVSWPEQGGSSGAFWGKETGGHRWEVECRGWILVGKIHARTYPQFSSHSAPFLYLDIHQQNSCCGSKEI